MSAMIPLWAATALFLAGEQVPLSMPPEVAKVVAGLRQRHESITSLSCVFRQKVTPTPYFVARAAKDMDVPQAKLRQNYSTSTRNDMVEAADGRFHLTITQIEEDGSPRGRDHFGFDGKNRWKQAESPLEGGKAGQFVTTKTEIGGGKRVDDLYGGSVAPVARFVGDNVLPSRKPLYATIQEGRDWEALGEETVSGSRCAVIRWRSGAGGVEQRFSLWLDTGRGLAIRRYLEEFRDPKKGWLRMVVCEAREMGVSRYTTPSGVQSDYHFPKVVTSEVYNADDHKKTFDERYDFDEVRINPSLSNELFALHIDEGTGVMDVATGRYSIYGRGPGPKLKKIIDKGVAEAHRQAYEAEASQPPGVLHPPQSLATRGAWAALALGAVGIAVALALKVRGFIKS